MEIIFIILIIIIAFYILNLFLCFLYCREKKKRGLVKTEISNVPAGDSKPRKGIVWNVKQLLNGWMMYSVVCLGKVPCQKYRLFMLKNVYQMSIGKNVVIYGGCRFWAPWNISIGKGTIVGDGCSLDGRNGIVIGENVNLSTDVYIYTEQHDINDPYFESGDSGGSVYVGDRAWLSSRTTILPKVQIGEGAVLASGALASKSLDAYGVYGGMPAKKIGERSHDLRYEFDGSYLPFY